MPVAALNDVATSRMLDRFLRAHDVRTFSLVKAAPPRVALCGAIVTRAKLSCVVSVLVVADVLGALSLALAGRPLIGRAGN